MPLLCHRGVETAKRVGVFYDFFRKSQCCVVKGGMISLFSVKIDNKRANSTKQTCICEDNEFTYIYGDGRYSRFREREIVCITAVSQGVQWVLFIFLNLALKIKLNRNKALEPYINPPSAIQ